MITRQPYAQFEKIIKKGAMEFAGRPWSLLVTVEAFWLHNHHSSSLVLKVELAYLIRYFNSLSEKSHYDTSTIGKETATQNILR